MFCRIQCRGKITETHVAAMLKGVSTSIGVLSALTVEVHPVVHNYWVFVGALVVEIIW